MSVDGTFGVAWQKLLPPGTTATRVLSFVVVAVGVVSLTVLLAPLRTALVVALAVLMASLYWIGIVIAHMRKATARRIARKTREETERRAQRERDRRERARLRKQAEERERAEEREQAEAAEFTRLEKLLWNGYSTTALTELRSFSKDTGRSRSQRAQALELVADWYEITGDLEEHTRHRHLALRVDPAMQRGRAGRTRRAARVASLRGCERKFDVVVVSDLSVMGGTSGSNLQELQAQAGAGVRTGVFHQPFAGRGEGRPLNGKLLAAVDNDHTRLVRPEDRVSCDLLIVRHPRTLARLLERMPRIETRRVLLVVNQPPFHYYGEEGGSGRSWDIGHTREALAGWVGHAEWAPIGPAVRDALLEHHAEELRGVQLTDEDWVNIIDLPVWRRSGRRLSDGKVRIGRHSRDHPTKWPESAESLSAIYPEEEGYEVHVLGGAGTATEIRGALPLNWVVHRFDALPAKEFLHGLDVYVYYTNSAYVEAFGRAPLEAMAAGVPTILPPCFRDLFGEAAIYAEPDDVRREIDALMADPERYRTQVERSWEVLEERFGQGAHLRRLAALGVRSEAGAR